MGEIDDDAEGDKAEGCCDDASTSRVLPLAFVLLVGLDVGRDFGKGGGTSLPLGLEGPSDGN
jgi:hypothetical protein